MTDGQKLREAARLVDEVVRAIDVEATACGCCGKVTFGNWSGKLAADALGPLAEKLRRFASRASIIQEAGVGP